MAWSAPRTWVTGELVSAAIMNTHVRDQLLETAPAKVTSTGDVVYATAANALARLGIGSARRGLRVNAAATAPEWSAKIDSFFPIYLSGDPGAYLYTEAPGATWEEMGADQIRTYLARFDLDFDNLPATQQAKLVAVMKIDAGCTTGSLRLRNITDAANYTAISTASEVYTRVRSAAAFDLPTSGLKEFTLHGMSAGQTGVDKVYILKAWLELL